MAECNDYEGLRINPTPSSIGNQYAGVSTSDKPTGVPTYSIYLELDTGKFYYYDGSEWQELPCSCSGGGGGSEASTAKVTLNLTADDDTPFIAEKVYASFGFGTAEYCAYVSAVDHVAEIVTYNEDAHIYEILGRVGEHNIYSGIVGDPVCTGGVEYISDGEYFVVTGDGTITVTLSAGGDPK